MLILILILSHIHCVVLAKPLNMKERLVLNYATAALLKLINGSSFGRNEFTIFWL